MHTQLLSDAQIYSKTQKFLYKANTLQRKHVFSAPQIALGHTDSPRRARRLTHVAHLLSSPDVLYNTALPHETTLTHNLDTVCGACIHPHNPLAKPIMKRRILQCTKSLENT